MGPTVQGRAVAKARKLVRHPFGIPGLVLKHNTGQNAGLPHLPTNGPIKAKSDIHAAKDQIYSSFSQAV